MTPPITIILLITLALTACATRTGPDADWRMHMDAGARAAASGDSINAERELRTALDRANALGPDNPERASTLAALANVLSARGDAQAEATCLQAIAACAAAFGPEDINVLTIRDSLARLQVSRGDFSSAEITLRETLAIRTRTCGPEGGDTAYNQAMLADVLRTAGRGSQAESLYRAALATWQKLGGNAENSISAERGLAHVLADREDYIGARQALERAIRATTANTVDRSTGIQVLSELAMLLIQAGDLPGAEQATKETITAIKVTNGLGAIELVPALDARARVLAALGRIPEATTTIAQALSISEHRYGAEHPTLIPLLDAQSQIFATTNLWNQARTSNERAMNLIRQSQGTDNADYLGTLNRQIVFCTAMNDLDRAIMHNDHLIAILRRTTAANDPNTALAVRNHNDLLRRQQRGVNTGIPRETGDDAP